jgi:hypothetical protein
VPATEATLEGGAAEKVGGVPLAAFVHGEGWLPVDRNRGGVGRSSAPPRAGVDVGGRRGERGGRREVGGWGHRRDREEPQQDREEAHEGRA